MSPKHSLPFTIRSQIEAEFMR